MQPDYPNNTIYDQGCNLTLNTVIHRAYNFIIATTNLPILENSSESNLASLIQVLRHLETIKN